MKCPPEIKSNIPFGTWESLTPDDQMAFLRLRESVRQGASTTSKGSAFHNELKQIAAFVDRSSNQRLERSVIVGFMSTPSAVFMNTRQLAMLVGRCKSSVNSHFQQSGYVSPKMKVRYFDFLVERVPVLLKSPQLLKQWTVRIRTEDSQPPETSPDADEEFEAPPMEWTVW